jgi:hypothetical protein
VQTRFLPALAALGALLCPARSVVSSGLDVYTRSIQQLGGSLTDPAAFPENLEGFEEYLRATGVTAISAAEMTRPNHPGVAARLGFRDFLPPRAWWPRGAALALLAQKIQHATGTSLRVRNWWRPSAYNTDPAVGGAKNGDHPTASALDLDYPSVGGRMQAERFLRGLERQAPWMQLSFGFGPQTTHVGLASPRGHREWHYAGWKPAL